MATPDDCAGHTHAIPNIVLYDSEHRANIHPYIHVVYCDEDVPQDATNALVLVDLDHNGQVTMISNLQDNIQLVQYAVHEDPGTGTPTVHIEGSFLAGSALVRSGGGNTGTHSGHEPGVSTGDTSTGRRRSSGGDSNRIPLEHETLDSLLQQLDLRTRTVFAQLSAPEFEDIFGHAVRPQPPRADTSGTRDSQEGASIRFSQQHTSSSQQSTVASQMVEDVQVSLEGLAVSSTSGSALLGKEEEKVESNVPVDTCMEGAAKAKPHGASTPASPVEPIVPVSARSTSSVDNVAVPDPPHRHPHPTITVPSSITSSSNPTRTSSRGPSTPGSLLGHDAIGTSSSLHSPGVTSSFVVAPVNPGSPRLTAGAVTTTAAATTATTATTTTTTTTPTATAAATATATAAATVASSQVVNTALPVHTHTLAHSTSAVQLSPNRKAPSLRTMASPYRVARGGVGPGMGAGAGEAVMMTMAGSVPTIGPGVSVPNNTVPLPATTAATTAATTTSNTTTTTTAAAVAPGSGSPVPISPSPALTTESSTLGTPPSPSHGTAVLQVGGTNVTSLIHPSHPNTNANTTATPATMTNTTNTNATGEATQGPAPESPPAARIGTAQATMTPGQFAASNVNGILKSQFDTIISKNVNVMKQQMAQVATEHLDRMLTSADSQSYLFPSARSPLSVGTAGTAGSSSSSNSTAAAAAAAAVSGVTTGTGQVPNTSAIIPPVPLMTSDLPPIAPHGNSSNASTHSPLSHVSSSNGTSSNATPRVGRTLFPGTETVVAPASSLAPVTGALGASDQSAPNKE